MREVMSSLELFVADVQQLLPAMLITSEPDALRDYTIDGVLPRLVITPTTKEEAGQCEHATWQ